MHTRSCGSSSTGCAGTSSWILRGTLSKVQQSRRLIADVLAIATDLYVELSEWCSWRLLDAKWLILQVSGAARLQVEKAASHFRTGSQAARSVRE